MFRTEGAFDPLLDLLADLLLQDVEDGRAASHPRKREKAIGCDPDGLYSLNDKHSQRQCDDTATKEIFAT
jgi:hypothetical protein